MDIVQHIEEIPIEFEDRAKRNPTGFVRAFWKYPIGASQPFFRDREVVSACIDKQRANPFYGQSFTFNKHFACRDEFDRYVHIDLSWTGDRCGIAMCCVPDFVSIERKVDPEVRGFLDRKPLPYLFYDFIGIIEPSQQESREIRFGALLEVIYLLSDLGFNIKLITYDRFQSISSIQQLQEHGYIAAPLSLDRTANVTVVDIHEKHHVKKISTHGNYTFAYEEFRDAMYDKRVSIPFYNPKNLSKRMDESVTLFEDEAFNLEENEKTKSVDHTPKGSKDLLDAMVGAGISAIVNEYGMPQMLANRPEEPFAQESYVDKSIHTNTSQDKKNIEKRDSFKYNISNEAAEEKKNLFSDDAFDDDDNVFGY